MGWEGSYWGNFFLHGLKESTHSSSESSKTEPLLFYKYLPMTGRENKGKAAEEYTVIYEGDANPRVKHTVLKTYKAQKASFEFDPLDWEQLPTLHHIVSRLAEIPVYEVMDARIVEGEGVPDLAAARPIN